ncbi:hypothetical protein GGF46_005020 [Coemansia sp. RSA 552]|nr:hypothetical protein GGF46_005020 [Coemansia sp. RSA 552]
MASDTASFEGLSSRDILGHALGAAPDRRQEETPSRTIDISNHGVIVNGFSISGVSRIRRGFVGGLVEPIFAAKTMGQVVLESREAAGRLQALGIAKEVDVELDRAVDGREGVDVRFWCKDGSRYVIKTGVNVGDDEGTASVTGRLNNIWGGGESLEANYTRGNKTQAAFQALLRGPIDADPQKQWEVGVHQAAINNRPYSAHDEVRRTLSSALHFARFNRAVHELRYVASWRDICNLGSGASPTLRGEAGHTLKSSVSYTFAHDDRDSHTVPTRGSLVKATAEVAGLLGDVRFGKMQAEVQANQRLGRSEYILSTGVQGGLLWAFGQQRSSPLADRFFLGGQTSVRGFEYHGIGPRDHNDSVGGDVYYAAGISLLTPLPYVQTTALKGHVWANAGQLGLLDSRGLLRKSKCGGTVTGEIQRFFMRPSVAAGFGLVYRHSMVRVELSCGLPLVAATTDRPKAGLQFGLGLQFL